MKKNRFIKKNWFPLDNAAKIYPAISNSRRANVFSYSAFLTENVDVTFLDLAINNVLLRNPTLKVKLKKGLFWYYFEKNNNIFLSKEETPHYLSYINPEENRDYLFKVLYKENKITIVVFHALTDGFGGLTLFREIIFEYLKLMGHDVKNTGEIKSEVAPFEEAEGSDNFLTYDKKDKYQKTKNVKPFKLDGTPFSVDGCGMIIAKTSLSGLKAISKQYSTTITGYLVGLYLYTVYDEFLKDSDSKNRLVSIVVPLNMRKRYSSKTMRNFSLFTRVPHDFTKEASLEDCIAIADKCLKEGVERDKLNALIHENVKLEKNIFIKILPLMLKNPVMRLAYDQVGDNLTSANFSNIGECVLPESVKKYVTDVIFTIAPTYSCKHDIGVISYGDNIYISFTRLFVENRIERAMIQRLAKLLPVEISSNNLEGAKDEVL